MTPQNSEEPRTERTREVSGIRDVVTQSAYCASTLRARLISWNEAMTDDPNAILQQLAQVVEKIYGGYGRGLDLSPLFKSEARPLIEKLKRISSDWPGGDEFRGVIDELEPWFAGDIRDRHRFQANAVLGKLRCLVEEHNCQ